MRRGLVALTVTAASLAATLAAGATTAATTKFEVQLRGANERPAAPATNRGKVELRLTPATGRVCWDFSLTKIDGRPLQAHIHKGARGVSGNIVVPLGGNYTRQGCINGSKATVKAILRRPAGYYVNVHNAKHPLGAMRGQL